MLKEQDNPLISFIVITYNQENYIREAIQGALAQTYSPLEIVISDDCSTDNTVQIIKKTIAEYKGEHKIIINRNEKNLGIGGNINRVVKLCSGIIIVASAGDDVSLPERTEEIYYAYKKSDGRAKLICSNAYVMNSSGEVYGDLKDMSKNGKKWNTFSLEKFIDTFCIPAGATHAWSRELFDIFGNMITPVNGEDFILPFRAALLGDVLYIDKYLIKYRKDYNIFRPRNITIDFNSRIKILSSDKMVLKNRIKDIEIYEAIDAYKAKHKNTNFLKKKILPRIDEIEKSILLYNLSHPKRMITIIQWVADGMPWRIARRKIGIFLIPNIYNIYIKIKYKIL